MRHRVKTEKFSRSRAKRKALVRSLLRSLIIYERIVTQEAKAKKIRPWIDKLITWSKEDTLSNRRLCYKYLGDHNLVKKLFENIGPRYKDINGGYTRIIDLGYRKGDSSKMAILELTKIQKKEKKVVEKKQKEKQPVVEQKVEEKHIPKKEEQPKKGILSNIKRIFKRERDAL